jgi:hypothetical protein
MGLAIKAEMGLAIKVNIKIKPTLCVKFINL